MIEYSSDYLEDLKKPIFWEWSKLEKLKAKCCELKGDFVELKGDFVDWKGDYVVF